LIAIGIALWAIYFVQNILEVVRDNFQQTQCNQGLLTLATLDNWEEGQLAKCRAPLYNELKEKYR
jgi:hypothetical protein